MNDLDKLKAVFEEIGVKFIENSNDSRYTDSYDENFIADKCIKIE